MTVPNTKYHHDKDLLLANSLLVDNNEWLWYQSASTYNLGIAYGIDTVDGCFRVLDGHYAEGQRHVHHVWEARKGLYRL
jgi:hypothetical protein